MMEGEFRAVPQTFTIDIGRDGGKLTIDQSQPVTRYVINGEPASEEDAWAWIYRWHCVRDAALGTGPCGCPPCSWMRMERDFRLGPGPVITDAG